MKNEKMLVSFKQIPEEQRWNACICALAHEYTITIRDICQKLKCSRSWAARYLKPYLHYIYVSNGAGRKVNFLRVASITLNKVMTETTWYSEREFNNLVMSHITSVTRRTIRIPIELLISKNKMQYFLQNYKTNSEIYSEADKEQEKYKYVERELDKRETLIIKCLSKKGRIIFNNLPSKYKRTNSPEVDYEFDVLDIDEFVSVHDIKTYGDTDEDIYRNLFEVGYCKVVLRIADENGNYSEKKYYIKPQDTFDIKNSVDSILINYSDYLNLIR